MSAEPDTAKVPAPGERDGGAEQPPVRDGVFAGFLRRLARWWGGRREPEPFDFQRFEFPRLDIDAVAERLRLHELAQQNGRDELPPPDARTFDGPQERIVQFIRGEVSRISANYETSLAGTNRRIQAIDVPSRVQELKALPSAFEAGLAALTQRIRFELAGALRSAREARDEYERFRSERGLVRAPRYPDSHLYHFAVLFAVAVIEGLVNAIFFARGNDLGLLGGTLYALLMAGVDVFVVFRLGRWIGAVTAREWHYRLAGFTAALVFVAWAIGFNLLVGHVREALQVDAETAMRTAWAAFQEAPLGLDQADSWLLVAIGFALSVVAMGDGLRWDDPCPGYGEHHRRWQLAEREAEHWRMTWREHASRQREEAQQRIASALRDARREVVALESAIDTKALLLRNIRTFASHYEESCNALIQDYRDENRRCRTTPVPPYFGRPWDLELSERLSDDTERDQERLARAQDALRHADEAAARARDESEQIYQRFVQQVEAELSA